MLLEFKKSLASKFKGYLIIHKFTFKIGLFSSKYYIHTVNSKKYKELKEIFERKSEVGKGTRIEVIAQSMQCWKVRSDSGIR